MIRLTGAELRKVWGKRGFLLSCIALLTLDLFLLWYAALPGENRPGLSAWRRFQQTINGMSEQEKGEYMQEQMAVMDGIRFVEEILMLQSIPDEAGETMAAQARENHPGIFEQYYELYLSGDYLELTDSPWLELELTEMLYTQWEKCAGYGEYLLSVQEQGSTLGNIGIFAGKNQDTFASRNVRKSARDYGRLSAEDISWMPDRAVTGAMENVWTDFLLLLSVFFFVGNMVLEEKEKHLFYIIRSTRRGMLENMVCRLAALLLHCGVMTILLYGANLAFFGSQVGFGDLGARLQSLAAYRESILSISIRGYILLSMATKSIVLFGFGALLSALCIAAERIYLPYGGGLLLVGVSYILYTVIPAACEGNILKYLNLFGILKTENLYGRYLNFNFFGYPVSRLLLSWILILFLTGMGILLGMYFYWRGDTLVFHRIGGFSVFRPHGSLLLHESFKLLISNKTLAVLLLFGFLAAGREWNHSYVPSVQESYYQDLMQQLEGDLTAEKEALVLAEQDRYQKAFDHISQIDRMVSDGNLTERAGEDRKMEFYVVTAFYPAFLRVWEQYQEIAANGGQFVYDTGYLYLSGRMGESMLADLLMLSCGITLAFCGAGAMEDAIGTWYLLGSTRKGRRAVLRSKLAICIASAFLLSIMPLVCRGIRVSEAFPLMGYGSSIRNIPALRDFRLPMPLWCFPLLLGLSQGLVAAGTAAVVFLLSCWHRDTIQACLFATLLFILPLVLALLGFTAAEGFSLYPLYSWLARL